MALEREWQLLMAEKLSLEEEPKVGSHYQYLIKCLKNND